VPIEDITELGTVGILPPPRHHLDEAASGKQRVELKDIEGLLAFHLLNADEQATAIAEHTRDLIPLIFAPEQGGSFDREAALRLAERLTRLYSIQIGEVRKTAELLSRLVRPARSPSIRVLAAVNADHVSVG
jgi:hypothetical protein